MGQICQTTCIDQQTVEQMKQVLPDVTPLAQLFKVLGDETRAKIVWVLTQKELCVCDLAAILSSSPSNISHHLRLLRNFRLVKYRRQGKMVFYSLDDEHVRNIIEQGFLHAAHP